MKNRSSEGEIRDFRCGGDGDGRGGGGGGEDCGDGGGVVGVAGIVGEEVRDDELEIGTIGIGA